MLLGPVIGAAIDSGLGYEWAFNICGIFLFILFIIAAFTFPFDPPLGKFAENMMN